MKPEIQEKAKGIYFIKQRISNACGTIGLIHALMNSRSSLATQSFKEGSWLDQFFIETMGMDPLEKAQHLESDEKIEHIHQSTAVNLGQSQL